MKVDRKKVRVSQTTEYADEVARLEKAEALSFIWDLTKDRDGLLLNTYLVIFFGFLGNHSILISPSTFSNSGSPVTTVAERFIASAVQKQSAKDIAAVDFTSPACNANARSIFSKLTGNESMSDITCEAASCPFLRFRLSNTYLLFSIIRFGLPRVPVPFDGLRVKCQLETSLRWFSKNRELRQWRPVNSRLLRVVARRPPRPTVISSFPEHRPKTDPCCRSRNSRGHLWESG